MGNQDDRNLQQKLPQGGSEQRSGTTERSNPQRTSEQRDNNPRAGNEQRAGDTAAARG